MSAPCPPMPPCPPNYAVEVYSLFVNHKVYLSTTQGQWDVNRELKNLQIGAGTNFAGAMLRGGAICTEAGLMKDSMGITFKVNDQEWKVFSGSELRDGVTFYDHVAGLLNDGFNEFTLTLWHAITGTDFAGSVTLYLEVYYGPFPEETPPAKPPPSNRRGYA